MSMWEIECEVEGRKVVSILGLMCVYVKSINKEDYPDFECWKADMIKMGLIKEV